MNFKVKTSGAKRSNAKSRKRGLSTVLATSFLLVLPSCGIPQLRCGQKGDALPGNFNNAANLQTFAEDASLENSAQLAWCEFFDDPVLTNLISQAMAGNQELKILAEEIQIASNEVQARQGEYLPFVTVGAGAGLEKPSLFTPAGAVEDQLNVLPGKPFPDPLPDFLVATNVTWELDIWRKLRNAKDAACLRYLGTRDGRNYVATRMVAEVAENYYELLALDNQLETLNKTIEIQEASLETSKAMKEGGRGTELAVQRFQAEVRKNQSEKLIIQQQVVEAENRINFLLGRYPQPVERISVEFIDLNLHALSAGMPSQLLRNRSDIRQAERQLAAAGLDVKSARANFYPSLALSAGVGYRAFNTRYLFSSPESLIYNVAGDLVAPLINKKAIKAAYRTANAVQLQSLYNYQRTVLNAYTEVVNYMSKVENYRQSIEIKKQQLASLESSVENATNLFQNARAEYVEVLLAQRDMMEAKMVLIETKQEQLAAIVNAYQALGGGCGGGNGGGATPLASGALAPATEVSPPVFEAEPLPSELPPLSIGDELPAGDVAPLMSSLLPMLGGAAPQTSETTPLVNDIAPLVIGDTPLANN